MGFERFGRISFTSQTKAAAFVDYLEKEELRYTKCRTCGQAFFPPRADCASCLSSDMEWVKVADKGKLISFTRACYAPTGFEEDVPYVLAVADFNTVKVFGRLKAGISLDELQPGMDVQVKTVSLPAGQISYEFVPA
jgi:uncharacterized OB-fold protein